MARVSADKRREQFVQAAIRVMAQEGLERATTRRIAEEADAPQGVFHYLFEGKTQLLTEVLAAITGQIEQILRDAVDPVRGLAAAIEDGITAFWGHVVGDDGLQLMQYELMIFARRTEGLEWLASWQYGRYESAAFEVFGAAAAAEGRALDVELDELCRFVVAAMDGLIIQYEVHHDTERSERDLRNVIRAAQALAGVGATR